jgi:hypothetical protein
MRKTAIFTKLDPEADRILEAFAQRTGLAGHDGDERRIFQLEGAGRDVDVRRELRAVDAAWGEHLRWENPG